MKNNSYTVGLYTLGCKVSLYETEAIAEAFAEAGFEVRDFDEVCDVYVINTCTVTAESDAKSRKYVRRAIKKNPDAKVIVVGCYSQRSPGEVAAIDGVGAVIGTADKLSAVKCAMRLLDGEGQIVSVSSLDGASFEKMCVKHAPRTRAYVKIEDGCECKCTYCAISAARGPVRSKPEEDVISEVEALYRSGVREVVLTGIETGSYGTDLGNTDLAQLISKLDERHSCDRIRLGSMAPELLSEKFISGVGRLGILVPHFHISMQSGSDNVLKNMKRRYNRRMALDNIKRIREYMPRVMLTADLMVGFPGESEEDFLDTVSFVREARLLDAHVFAYSRREGTPAAEYSNQIPDSVKRQRSATLIREVAAVRDGVLESVCASGELLPTVFEQRCAEYFSGHSDSYIEVRVKCDEDIRGELIYVHPEYHKDGVVYGSAEKNKNN